MRRIGDRVEDATVKLEDIDTEKPSRKARKKWTVEETQMLEKGCRDVGTLFMK